VRNAAANGGMTAADCRLAFRQIEEDLRDGLLLHTPIAGTEAFRRADDISGKHAATERQRTTDLLHVALVREYGAKAFLSFDTRQRKFARAAGLKVKS